MSGTENEDLSDLQFEIVQNASGSCEVVKRCSEPRLYRCYARFYGIAKDANAALFIAAISTTLAPAVSEASEALKPCPGCKRQPVFHMSHDVCYYCCPSTGDVCSLQLLSDDCPSTEEAAKNWNALCAKYTPLPCPICGNSPVCAYSRGTKGWTVGCRNRHDGGRWAVGKERETAVQNWNDMCRAPSAGEAELRAELAGAIAEGYYEGLKAAVVRIDGICGRLKEEVPDDSYRVAWMVRGQIYDMVRDAMPEGYTARKDATDTD